MAEQYFGQYGGRVLRPFQGAGKKFIAGATLTPEDVETWPVANRIALGKNGNIDWYGPPSPQESEARNAGKSKPGIPKKEKSEEKDAPKKKSRRTK